MGGAGCGGRDGCGGPAGCGGSGGKELTVSAAASLQSAFAGYAGTLNDMKMRYSFAGSDALAAQIEQGVRPDVFASANTKLPAALYAKHLVDKPVVFAGNRLVLAVPAGSDIHSIADLQKPGTTIAVGAATVPVGTYTETVLGRLPPARGRRSRRTSATASPTSPGSSASSARALPTRASSTRPT